MNYKLSKKLKDAGFPISKYGQNYSYPCAHYRDFDKCLDKSCRGYDGYETKNKEIKSPTLSELIEACGDLTMMVGKDKTVVLNSTYPLGSHTRAEGSTPEEAVANLWLKLHE